MLLLQQMAAKLHSLPQTYRRYATSLCRHRRNLPQCCICSPVCCPGNHPVIRCPAPLLPACKMCLVYLWLLLKSTIISSFVKILIWSQLTLYMIVSQRDCTIVILWGCTFSGGIVFCPTCMPEASFTYTLPKLSELNIRNISRTKTLCWLTGKQSNEIM